MRYVFYENSHQAHEGVADDTGARLDGANDKQKLVHSIDLLFDKCNMASNFSGRKKLPGSINYFKGDKSRWVHGAKAYSELLIEDLYEGIDFKRRPGTSIDATDFQYAQMLSAAARHFDS